MGEVILKMSGISKSFAAVPALKNASLELKKGEVVALMGENGAGKSTLMKILTGIYEKDAGSIVYEGKEVEFKSPGEAKDNGIVIVHQELNMMNHLTVAQNIFIGRESMKYKFLTDDSVINKKSEELFNRLNISINPKELVGNLTVGRQQMVEIAKAISTNAKIIVFDEPTAALTDNEIVELFKIIDDLKSKDIGIIYISHRMDEIEKITDRVTVMRDGEYIGTLVTKETNKSEIIDMMVGRVIYEEPKSKSNVLPDAPVVLSVENLNVGNSVKNLSFELKKGEILGFSGLMGAGRTEMARAIFGADKKDNGTVTINGNAVDIKTPGDAVSCGIAYLSEDRKRYGVVVGLTVTDNTVMTHLDNYSKLIMDDRRIYEDTKSYIEKLKIKTSSPSQLIRNLSGGNQQKVVIAKWLIRNCQILIFDEPTRGIDVGAKSEIYKLMNELVAEGKSIIMISSELPEVLRMSDRVIVMCEGRKTGELAIEEATQNKIIHFATMRE